jgi:mono/diheme cytochrome c family protein
MRAIQFYFVFAILLISAAWLRTKAQAGQSQIDRGRYIVESVAMCRQCHSQRQPSGADTEFIRLLTTGVSRSGVPPSSPMPPFRMSRADAEAVLAYMKSL